MDNNQHYSTIITPLAIFLICEGLTLSKITYSKKANGKNQATFHFSESPSIVRQSEETYFKNDALVNPLKYEDIKTNILDRIKRGLP